MSTLQAEIIELNTRLAKLEAEHGQSAIRSIKKSLGRLQQWRMQIERDFNRKQRRKLAQFGRTLVFLISGSAVILAAFGYVAHEVGEELKADRARTEEDFRGHIKEIAADLTRTLDKQTNELEGESAKVAIQAENVEKKAKESEHLFDQRVKDALSGDQILASAERNIRFQFETDSERLRSEVALGILSSTLTQLRIHIEEAAGKVIFRPGTEPDLVQELVYVAQSILEDYSGPLSSANVPDSRRNGLLFTMNGMVEEARSDDAKASYWYGRAVASDPTLPEPHILLGRLLMHGVVYSDNGQFQKPPQANWKQLALAEFRTAVTCQGDHSLTRETRRVQPYIYWLSGNFDAAIRDATNEIEFEGGVERADPRLIYRRGFVHWTRTFNQSGQVARGEAERQADLQQATSDFFYVAWREPDYLKASNNFLWAISHDLNEKIVDLTENREASAKTRLVLRQFLRLSLRNRFPECIETAAYAEAAVGDLDLAWTLVEYAIKVTESNRDLAMPELREALDTELAGFRRGRNALKTLIDKNLEKHPDAGFYQRIDNSNLDDRISDFIH